MKPGATMRPVASKTSASAAERFAPVFKMRPPSNRTSKKASVLVAGSRTRPFLISSIRSFLCRMWRVDRSSADQMVEKSHAHGEAIGHLIEHARLRTIRYGGINFEAADHRSRMENECIVPREPQPLRGELVAENVLLGGERWFVNSFRLHAQHDDHVCAVERFFNSRRAPQAACQVVELARHPHRWSAECDPRAELAEQMNIRAGHAAVQDIS